MDNIIDLDLREQVILEGKKVFEKEIVELKAVQRSLDDTFYIIVKMISEVRGKVIVTGVGKSGHIARKIAATFSSLGIPAFYLHPTEAVHGDLGCIMKQDIVLTLSNSGETDEVLAMIPSLKTIGSKLISFVGKKNSKLEQYSDASAVINISQEACHNNLAPTSSTTAQLLYGDAVAVAVSKINKFSKKDFALYHPSGILGKQLLLKVKDIMTRGQISIYENSTLKEAILTMSNGGISGVAIVNDDFQLKGIFTDGDLRRLLEVSTDSNVFKYKMSELMVKNPLVVNEDELVVNAISVMQKRHNPIIILPVINNYNQLVGLLRIHDILKEGLMV